MKPVVGLVESKSHYDGVLKALSLIENQVAEEIKGKKKVLIKPNFVSTSRQLAATHVDAVRAVLDFLEKHYSGKVIIGEGPSVSSLRSGLINFGYLWLQDKYDVEFVDLNRDDYIEVEGYDSRLRPLKFRLSKTAVESDYRISLALPKTHDTVIVTLAVKNMVMGSVVGHDKERMHQGYKAINLSIAKLAQTVMPHLGVIDGYVGMEGRGPVSGDPVNLRIAAASVYPVSLDAVVTEIMGFNPSDVGYLYHLSKWGVGVIDTGMIEIIGKNRNDVAREFKPHPRYGEMLKWKD